MRRYKYMLNRNIKIDLHIHSYASFYKEPKYNNNESIVSFSTINNIETLLDKLLANDISLFSITDHNRYDLALYDELERKIKEEKFNSLHLLHGIEFDVKLDEDKSVTHIIVIFDVKNNADMEKIDNVMKENELSEKNAYYNKDKFELILRKIGLNTLLIVHQRCSLERKKGKHKSLSEAVDDPYRIIQVGYINALEYQKPYVEGIIKNNLRNIDYEIALVTGSDCHDWRYYPKHDGSSHINEHYFSKCKILPSFKGLLLGLTSPKSRFNRREIQNTNYIRSFEINGETVNLDPGINVIIGENGSGKSTLFSLLCNDDSLTYIKKLEKENQIKTDINGLQFHVVKQAELVKKFHEDSLFKDEKYFNEIDTNDFENKFNIFSDNLKNIIKSNIQKNISYISLNNKNFTFDLDKELGETFYVNIEATGLDETENIHKQHRNALASILEKLYYECNDDYYDDEIKSKLYISYNNIKDVYYDVLEKEKSIELQNKVKNIILGEISTYNEEITSLSTSQDKEIINYKDSKSNFIKDIIRAIKLNISVVEKPIKPSALQGHSQKRYNGYVFCREMNYNNANVLNNFLEIMFTKEYRDLEKLMHINTRKEFSNAIFKCTSEDNIDEFWESNFSKFMQWAKKQRSYIKEESTDDSIGNTLGELSLVYYKFQTKEDDNWDVLMIDQPEDNISNNRIANKLLKYFDFVRRNKQLILVTHNPLLVVNLDADNIISLTKVNNKINVKSGCLEDEENNILDIVANTLDGGKDMIEKRLKIYGKEDFICNE